MPSGSTLTTRNSGSTGVVVGGVAPTTFVPPVGRVTPLDDAPEVAATFGDGTSIPVTWTLWPTYEPTDVPESWYVEGGRPGTPAVAGVEMPAVPATPAVDVVPPPVIVPVVPAVPAVPVAPVVPVAPAAPVVPVVTLGAPVGDVAGGGETVLGSGTVVGPRRVAFDNVNGAAAV